MPSNCPDYFIRKDGSSGCKLTEPERLEMRAEINLLKSRLKKAEEIYRDMQAQVRQGMVYRETLVDAAKMLSKLRITRSGSVVDANALVERVKRRIEEGLS